MILWCDDGHGPRENMRRDAALLAAADRGDFADPVLRVFRFAPAGITLGASQDPDRELDLARVRADGVEWALRPTGGRAIFHDEEWTFSLVASLGPGGWAGSPVAAYERTCALLARALCSLGVAAEFSPGSPGGAGSPRAREGAAPPCFASNARHELTLGGRKLAGIAQRRMRTTILQQGSVLLGDSHLRLAQYLVREDFAPGALRAALERSSAHAGEVLGPRAPLEQFAGAFAGLLPWAQRRDGPDALVCGAPCAAAGAEPGEA